MRQKSALLIPLLLHVGSIPPGGGTVDIVGPLLYLRGAAASRGVRLVGEIAEAPGDEPPEEDSHKKADGDNSNDEHKREVKHNVGRDTTDCPGVDKPDLDRLLKAAE